MKRINTENNLVKDTLLLCDNLISECIHKYTKTIFNNVKNSSNEINGDEKSLKQAIYGELTDIATSTNNIVKLEKKFSREYNCGFIFGQCFTPEITEVINSLLNIEFASDTKEKKRIAKIVADSNGWDENLTPNAVLILLEKKKTSLINSYTKEIYKKAGGTSVNEKDINKGLENYVQQKQLNRRQCKQFVRKYENEFFMHDFTERIKELAHKKQNIVFAPPKYKADLARKVQDKINNENYSNK